MKQELYEKLSINEKILNSIEESSIDTSFSIWLGITAVFFLLCNIISLNQDNSFNSMFLPMLATILSTLICFIYLIRGYVVGNTWNKLVIKRMEGRKNARNR